MENIIALIGLAFTAIAALLTYFNKKNTELEKKCDEYAEFLIRFFKLLKLVPNLDIIDYISYFKFKNTSIPPYIFYLCDKRKIKKLKKVLKVDYFIYYPNVTNSIDRSFDWFCKLSYFIYYLFASFFPVFFIVNLLYTFNKDVNLGDFSFLVIIICYVILTIFALVFSIFILYLVNSSLQNVCYTFDPYTTNKSFIKKKIKSKVKKYDKNKYKYYI